LKAHACEVYMSDLNAGPNAMREHSIGQWPSRYTKLDGSFAFQR
jgi:hypothetical protein